MTHVEISGRIPSVLTRRGIQRAVADAFLASKYRGTGSVSVAFVTDETIKRLNRTWRGIAKPTDVLSFIPGDVPGSGAEKIVGDLVISPAYVKRSSKKQGVPYREELLRVLVHGILHLRGFDHATLKDEKKMFGLQERILSSLVSFRPTESSRRGSGGIPFKKKIPIGCRLFEKGFLHSLRRTSLGRNDNDQI